MNKKDYFSKENAKKYMSNSQFKDFVNCEAMAMAKIFGDYSEPATIAMLVGSYVHAWNEGDLFNFRIDHPEITKKDGELKSEFRHADTIIDVIKGDKFINKALSGKKEVIMTAEMFGVEWKIMIDSYSPDDGFFSDLKIIADINGKVWDKKSSSYMNVYEAYGYYTQMAVYAEVERLHSGRDTHLSPYLVVIDKKDIPRKTIIAFESDESPASEFISTQLAYVESMMDRIKAVKNHEVEPIRCGLCDYCASTHQITSPTHFGAFNVY
jgi:hypothetical protein